MLMLLIIHLGAQKIRKSHHYLNEVKKCVNKRTETERKNRKKPGKEKLYGKTKLMH